MAIRQELGRARHVELKYLWLQDVIQRKILDMTKVSGPSDVADLGTKHLPERCIIRKGEALGLKEAAHLLAESREGGDEEIDPEVEVKLYMLASQLPGKHSFAALKRLLTSAIAETGWGAPP